MMRGILCLVATFEITIMAIASENIAIKCTSEVPCDATANATEWEDEVVGDSSLIVCPEGEFVDLSTVLNDENFWANWSSDDEGHGTH